MAIENIVAEHQGSSVRAHKLPADDECLREALGLSAAARNSVTVPTGCRPPRQPLKQRRSLGVEIRRMSRIPASISVESG